MVKDRAKKYHSHAIMYCARLDHFVRFNSDGSIGKCGHMIGAPGFRDWDDMQSSAWLQNVKNSMAADTWPTECRRCQDTENANSQSIRLASLDRDRQLRSKKQDYLILGGVLDNICNSACQSCNQNLSTKIGSLHGRDYVRVDNTTLFDRIPIDRVLEIDINGGEPAASPNYQALLQDLPAQVEIVRINTNGSRVLPNIESLLQRGIRVIITLSLDGTGLIHDYVRWPITWSTYQNTVDAYRSLRQRYDNLELQTWTTVHALNVADWPNIHAYAIQMDLAPAWAWLQYPSALDARFSNDLTLRAKSRLEAWPEFADIATSCSNQKQLDDFIQQQDRLRNISIRDYL